ncbi:MAG: 30S ribosomal protein S20 [Minisyncoccia bacterium]
MAITSSAKKALRSSVRKHVFNLRRKSKLSSATKAVKKSVAEGKPQDAAKLLSEAYKAIDKAAKRGIIKPNAASRKKSRLAASIKRATV